MEAVGQGAARLVNQLPVRHVRGNRQGPGRLGQACSRPAEAVAPGGPGFDSSDRRPNGSQPTGGRIGHLIEFGVVDPAIPPLHPGVKLADKLIGANVPEPIRNLRR